MTTEEKRKLLIDFVNKTQGNLIWGWSEGDSIKVVESYLKDKFLNSLARQAEENAGL